MLLEHQNKSSVILYNIGKKVKTVLFFLIGLLKKWKVKNCRTYLIALV